MSKISEFQGIVISMHKVNLSSRQPHFHARCRDYKGVFTIDPVYMTVGDLPEHKKDSVLVWAKREKPALLQNWRNLQAGQPLDPVKPL